MKTPNTVFRLLIRAGKAFQTTRLARIKICHKTLLEHAYRLGSCLLFSPEKITTFWNDTMYIPKGCPFSLLILAQSKDSRGSTHVFREHISPGMTVVDIGAHIGYYTLQSARLVGKTGRVYAFEPEPDNFALLTKNIELNGYDNAVCVQQAVADKSGTGELYLSRYSVAHSMASSLAQSRKKTPVKITSLDDFFQEAGWPPVDFIKMNIEGWEYFALKGMERLASMSPNLSMMLEYHPDHLLEAGVTSKAFLDQISNAGFKVYLIDENKGLQPFSETTLREDYWSNIYCEKG
jgi:FkbM family methyltransferase